MSPNCAPNIQPLVFTSNYSRTALVRVIPPLLVHSFYSESAQDAAITVRVEVSSIVTSLKQWLLYTNKIRIIYLVS